MNQFGFDEAIVSEICRQHDVLEVGVFGSVARGEEREDSDLDLLVRFGSKVSLLQLVALERKLSEAIGRTVDLLTENAISPYLRDRIYAELQPIYPHA